ncbi:MAG: sulfite reductase [Deltaproteobacteria bacterium RIFCSPLOWO2_12_FULL_60_19]|nr:MAG: sulfite reductase [Deltaproteobacteria bacterium RIFCSPLOWO2_12_FULL_60_19]
MAQSLDWKEKLKSRMAPDLAREIDIFETQIELRKQGKLDERVFAETRLRRGVYGQRYDNGQRHDGQKVQKLKLPSGGLTKGPETVWDAPGMLRIKIPFGGLNPEQMEALADLSEEYSDAISHVTTRQDIQYHFVHIDDTPTLMRRLAAVGITTREACGNVVRNVTACPLAGVCRDETFDVTPYAIACSNFLLGHPDTQDFGRKFKVAFSGCKQHPCGLTTMHDMGAIAKTAVVDGQERRGFEFYVGGGLGAVPYKAQLFESFLPEEELLPLAQAISRVFARLGEKRNRARARVKFLIANLGIEEFRRLVLEERAKLEPDPRWRDYLSTVRQYRETPLKPAASLNGGERPRGFDAWHATNVYRQRQPGYAVATVTLPLGDITAGQLRGLADIARRFVKDTIRTTVEQNIVLRWVSEADLPALYEALRQIGLGEANAGTIVDVTACPGTDTCKLGIASSRGLAKELRSRLSEKSFELDAAVKDLRIKVSGCFNSCGQHHIADIGFYGINRNINGYAVPHFQVMLGGKFNDNAGAYGLAIGAVPSKRIPEVVLRVTDRYIKERKKSESFQDFVGRIGKKETKAMLEDLTQVPAHAVDASFYRDWGDPREFTLTDMGVGECAGEVVSQAQFTLAASERELFEAQVYFDAGDLRKAVMTAYAAMVQAAQALVKTQLYDVSNDEAIVLTEFRKRFCDTELFYDKYAGGKFADYLFKAKETLQQQNGMKQDGALRLLQEAQLFIDAAHSCYNKLSALRVASPAGGQAANQGEG